VLSGGADSATLPQLHPKFIPMTAATSTSTPVSVEAQNPLNQDGEVAMLMEEVKRRRAEREKQAIELEELRPLKKKVEMQARELEELKKIVLAFRK